MQRVKGAELILSLFTSAERASSMAGDLMESAAGRGAWDFWPGVLRTAMGLFWRSFAADPWFIAGVGLRGLALNLCLYLLWFVGAVLVSAVYGIVAAMVGQTPQWVALFGWVFLLGGWIAMAGAQF